MIRILFIVIACIFAAGCDDARGLPGENTPGHHPTVGATLGHIGSWITYAGSALAAIGSLALAASFFPWTAFLAVFRSAIIEAIALGFTAILVGASLIWLGNNPWLLAVTIGLVVLFLGVRYRARIRRLLGFPKVKTTHA